MKLVNIALASIALLGVAVVGCGTSDNSSANGDSTLGTSEAQLVSDDTDSSNVDADLESGVDEPLSGASIAIPGAPGGKTVADIIGAVRLHAKDFYQPAGCLTSTTSGDTVTHVFDNCTGPYGMKTFNGTITTKYDVAGDGKITITHSATNFSVNGATISGERVVTYSESGTVWTKTRTGQWSGSTAGGKTLSHDASFVTTYDSSTQCLTRDGSAQSQVGGRSFERTVDNYKQCGVGRFGCPDSGELTLSTTKNTTTTTVKVTFEGGIHYSITRPNGRVVERVLVCNPRT